MNWSWGHHLDEHDKCSHGDSFGSSLYQSNESNIVKIYNVTSGKGFDLLFFPSFSLTEVRKKEQGSGYCDRLTSCDLDTAIVKSI